MTDTGRSIYPEMTKRGSPLKSQITSVNFRSAISGSEAGFFPWAVADISEWSPFRCSNEGFGDSWNRRMLTFFICIPGRLTRSSRGWRKRHYLISSGIMWIWKGRGQSWPPFSGHSANVNLLAVGSIWRYETWIHDLQREDIDEEREKIIQNLKKSQYANHW